MKINHYFIILFFLNLFSGCIAQSSDNLKVIEKYTKNLRYKADTIYIKENNVFTRKVYNLGFRKNYNGKYRLVNDTIFFDYKNSDGPKNELTFIIKKGNKIVVFEIYERIKDKYANLPPYELKKVGKKELMVKDTAKIDYDLVK
jgi:hypothetical protein